MTTQCCAVNRAYYCIPWPGTSSRPALVIINSFSPLAGDRAPGQTRQDLTQAAQAGVKHETLLAELKNRQDKAMQFLRLYLMLPMFPKTFISYLISLTVGNRL